MAAPRESSFPSSMPGREPNSFAESPSSIGTSLVFGNCADTRIPPIRGQKIGLPQGGLNKVVQSGEKDPSAVMRTIYFDYNATTPLDPGVKEAMLPYLGEVFGNPSSVHHVGRQARALLDDARDRAAGVLKSKPSEVIFTSGGT